jgi:hypothetical protein
LESFAQMAGQKGYKNEIEGDIRFINLRENL